MIRVGLIVVLLLVPAAVQAQRVHDARRAAVASYSADTLQRPLLALDQRADTGVARTNKIGLFALGGAFIGAAIVAVAMRHDYNRGCEDFCTVQPRLGFYPSVMLGAVGGGLLGALIGTIATD